MTALERISSYLDAGGLFNPELMEHDKVRDLLLSCRESLITAYTNLSSLADKYVELEKKNAQLRAEVDRLDALWRHSGPQP